MTMDVNKNRFQARLARIDAGQQWQADGVISNKCLKERAAQKRNRGRKPRLGKGEILRVPLAFAIGMLVVLVARVAFFHDVTAMLDSLPKQIPDTLRAMGPIGMAAALALCGVLCFGLTRGMRPHALAMGFLLMMYGEQQVIAQAPGVFAHLYSADYVAKATQTAKTI